MILNKEENKNIILFYLANLISIFGTSIYTFSISLYVLKITGSSFNFSTTLILSILPTIFLNPIVGVIVDKFDKKKLVISANFFNGIFLLFIYLVSKISGLSLGIIYMSTFVINSINILFDVSIDSSIPNIASKEKIVNINAGNRIIDSISSILGPVIGGIAFVAFNIETFILINSISFFISYILDLQIDFELYKNNCIDSKMKVKTSNIKINYLIEIKEGFKYLIKERSIVDFIIIFIIVNFFISFSVSIPLPIVLNNILMISEKYYGFIQSGIPIGMILGAILTRKIINKVNLNSLFQIVGVILSVNIILLSIPLIISENYSLGMKFLVIYYFIVMILIGICISLIDIPFSYRLQTNIDEEYRGRVISLTMSLVKTVVPIAYLISGIIIDTINPYVIILAGGIVILISSLIFCIYTQRYKNKVTRG